MLFLSHEKSNYELIKEYLTQNSLLDENLPVETFNQAIINRAQELGFKYIEEYCRYLLLLPFRQSISEQKSLILEYNPIPFYRNGFQKKVVTKSTISDILQYSKMGESGQEESSIGWLERLLTKDLTIRNTSGAIPIYVLGIETATGEVAYTSAIQLTTILPTQFKIKIIALESNLKLLRQALDAVYPKAKIQNVGETERKSYFEETQDKKLKLSNEIRQLTRFVNFDIFTSFLNLKNFERYHLILCNTLPHFFPENIVKAIIERIIPYLKPGGLLFLPFKDNFKYPNFQGLNIIRINDQFVYRRNREDFKKIEDRDINRDQDTTENRLIYIKALQLEKRYDEAIQQAEAILADDDENLPVNHIIGDILVLKNQFSQAIRQYSKVLTIAPNFLPSRLNLAAINLLKGFNQVAVTELDELVHNLNNYSPALENYFKIDFESFFSLVQDFQQIITNNETLSLNKLVSKAESYRESGLFAPNIEIEDLYVEKKDESDTEVIDEDKKAKEETDKKPEATEAGTEQQADPPAENMETAGEISDEKETVSETAHSETTEESNLEKTPEPSEEIIEEQKEESVKPLIPLITQDIIHPEFKEAAPEAEAIFPVEQPLLKTDTGEDKTTVHKSSVDDESKVVETLQRFASDELSLEDLGLASQAVSAPGTMMFDKEKSKTRKFEIPKASGSLDEDDDDSSEKSKRKITQMKKPARALFLDSISLDDLNLPDSMVEKLKNKKAKENAPPVKPKSEEPLKITGKENPTTNLNKNVSQKKDYEKTPERPSDFSSQTFSPMNRFKPRQEISNRSPGIQPMSIASLKKQGERPSVPEKKVVEESLPRPFLISMRRLLARKKPQGIINFLNSMIPKYQYPHRETMELMMEICQLFKGHYSLNNPEDEHGEPIMEGKKKQVFDEIEKLRSVLKNGNMLEASMLFNQILAVKPLINDCSLNQKRRLTDIKPELEKAIKKQEKQTEKYKTFVDKYFTNPLVDFQRELWEVLSQLTPKEYLEETGKKYGLDISQLPDNLKK